MPSKKSKQTSGARRVNVPALIKKHRLHVYDRTKKFGNVSPPWCAARSVQFVGPDKRLRNSVTLSSFGDSQREAVLEWVREFSTLADAIAQLETQTSP